MSGGILRVDQGHDLRTTRRRHPHARPRFVVRSDRLRAPSPCHVVSEVHQTLQEWAFTIGVKGIFQAGGSADGSNPAGQCRDPSDRDVLKRGMRDSKAGFTVRLLVACW